MTTRNARGQQRRRTILAAAVRVVASQGAGGLTHRAAAAEAGVSLASTTYHFPSIVDLRRATLRYAEHVIRPEFAASLTCEGGGAAAIAELASRWRGIGLSHRAEFTALFSLLVESLHDAELRPDADELLAVPTTALTRTGVAAGAAEAVVASLVGLALVSLVHGDSAAAMSSFEAGATALMAGLGQSLCGGAVSAQG